MSLLTTAQISLASALTPAVASGLSNTVNILHVAKLLSGTGSGQADLLHTSTRVLAASTPEDLNFYDGSLKTPTGAPFAALSIRLLYLKPALANVNEVVIGNASATQWLGPLGAATHTLALRPNAPLLLLHPTTGWTVSNTVKLLKALNGGAGTPVTYDLVLLGSSV